MKQDSQLMDWYLETFAGDKERIRSCQDLIDAGHRGLAESLAVRSLKAKYTKHEVKANRGLKVNQGALSYII